MFVVYLLNCVQLFATLWNVAHQAPLSMEFSRQEHWSRLLFPSPGNLPDSRIESASSALQADSLPLGHQASPKSVKNSFQTILFMSWAHNIAQPMLELRNLLKEWEAARHHFILLAQIRHFYDYHLGTTYCHRL